VILGIRPEDLEDAEFAPRADQMRCSTSRVALAEPMGAELVTYFEIDAPPVITKDTRDLSTDSTSSMQQGQISLHSADRLTELRSRWKPLKVVFDVTRLYFFDPQTRLRSGSNDDARTAHVDPAFAVAPSTRGSSGRSSSIRQVRVHGDLRTRTIRRSARVSPGRARPRPRTRHHIVRYPGGNFVSGYNWEDGVGHSRSGRLASTSPGALSSATRSARTSSSTGRASPASSQCCRKPRHARR